MKYLGQILVMWLIVVVLPVSAEGLQEGPEMNGNDSLQTIPFKQEEIVNSKTIVKIVGVTLLGVLLALVVLLVLKKYQTKVVAGSDAKQRIDVQAIKRVSPKLLLLVTRVDDKEYLIAQSGDKVSIEPHRVLEQEQSKLDE